MTPENPDEHPLAGIDRLLAGALHLINLAEAQDRAPFEQIWWSLRGMKRGVVAALASIVNHKRRLSPTGAALLRTYLDEERACVYRHAVQLGLVPRVGDTTTPRPRLSEPARRFYRGATAPVPSPEDPSRSAEVGTALVTLMGC
ncbi:hypothetical protein [Nannocystis radixulma]|uniref:Uncharacterized protein n=1 Tax=Nannocystis radixulma TaxID=2995305 RepID=A0ABT5BSX9_9BACT|nr:hypothetical protein [Nannocystis radixulma]MDC0676087.1 hypothetical protein [Nannocystis radixulma]